MSGSAKDTSNGNKVLVTALIVGGVFMLASVLVCGTVAVIFLYNAPW